MPNMSILANSVRITPSIEFKAKIGYNLKI